MFSNTLKNKLFKASVGLISINLFAKVLGYGEKLLLAKYFGTGYQVDVYTVVITLIFSFFYFFREIVEPSILRIFLEKEKEENGEGWAIFNFGIRIILGLTIIVSVLIYAFPEKTIKIFASGFEGEKFLLAISLLRKTIISCIFLSLSTLTSIILNAKKYFVFPALGDLIFKLIIILGFLLIDLENGILGIGIAIVIASLLKLGLHLGLLYKNLSFSKLNVSKDSKAQMLRLSIPLLAGVIFSQCSGIIDNNFASKLQEGAISSISYAKKIIELPIVILPYVLSIVVFPFFSEFSIKNQTEKLHKLLTDTLYFLTILFLPLALYFVFNSYEIVELIFKRGAFDQNSVILTYKPLLIYSFGLVFFAIEAILVIYYFSQADTKTPVIIGIVCVCLNIVLTWVLIKKIGYLGIPLAYVIQKGIKNIWLLILKKEDLKLFLEIIKNKWMIYLIALSTYIGSIILMKFIFIDLIRIENNTFKNLSVLTGSFIIPFLVYASILWKGNLLKKLNIFNL